MKPLISKVAYEYDSSKGLYLARTLLSDYRLQKGVSLRDLKPISLSDSRQFFIRLPADLSAIKRLFSKLKPTGLISRLPTPEEYVDFVSNNFRWNEFIENHPELNQGNNLELLYDKETKEYSIGCEGEIMQDVDSSTDIEFAIFFRELIEEKN